jgi:hypothetical protein
MRSTVVTAGHHEHHERICGVLLIDKPLRSALGLSLLAALCLVVAALSALPVIDRFDGWGRALRNGLVLSFGPGDLEAVTAFRSGIGLFVGECTSAGSPG